MSNFQCILIDISQKNKFNEIDIITKEWNKINNDLISLDRSFEYLNWRIRDTNSMKYSIILIKENIENIGYAIINHNSSNLYLVEFIILKQKYIKV